MREEPAWEARRLLRLAGPLQAPPLAHHDLVTILVEDLAAPGPRLARTDVARHRPDAGIAAAARTTATSAFTPQWIDSS